MGSYYNDNDKYAAAWLRNLIAAGLLPGGDVDERSITDVQPDDLRGYTQVHLFAGIGGWPYALRLAGWPDSEPVWTGSCPCQPFSAAGKGRGESDPRHLWPEMRRLVAECLPPVLLGEQVASAAGRVWLAGVRADLEALGYAVGAADLCAAGIGAPHIRQRLFWLADTDTQGRDWEGVHVRRRGQDETQACLAGTAGGLGDAEGERRGWRADNEDPGRRGAEPRCCPGGLGDAEGKGRPGVEPEREAGQRLGSRPGGTGQWDNTVLIECGDGKTRRIESGLEPLAYGVPARVGRLRAYGNAIVPPLAAEFVTAFLETRHALQAKP